MRFIRTPFVALALAAAMPAQCLFTVVDHQPTGPGCNFGHTGCCATLVAPMSHLVPQLDAANCRLDVAVTGFQGCCGVTTPLYVLAFGFQPTFVPLPFFGLGCALQVDPIVFLATPGTAAVVNLPPGVQAFGFLAQGAALSQFSPLPDILAFTPPYSISLQ